MIIHSKDLLNKILNKIPVELHIPGYHYCGIGTKLSKLLAEGNPGINPLVSACKEHDISYSKNRENAPHVKKEQICHKLVTNLFHT